MTVAVWPLLGAEAVADADAEAEAEAEADAEAVAVAAGRIEAITAVMLTVSPARRTVLLYVIALSFVSGAGTTLPGAFHSHGRATAKVCKNHWERVQVDDIRRVHPVPELVLPPKRLRLRCLAECAVTVGP
ncbi:hypothetical protein ACSNOH_02235 [Streptomyces sp. URMC 127]|uniref:hypothetical protein n=1 Tax=Streptomyces sp. URMC 127 TaxID=3423402 RepID=UPI003F1E325C